MKNKSTTRLRQLTTAALMLILLTVSLSGQIVINEFSASNSTQIKDPDFNDFADWIELYNAGQTAVNLNGYYITDNFGSPMKWHFSDDFIIQSGGYMLVWTDDRDTANHTSFKLSALGEEIALYTPQLILLDSLSFPEQRTDISRGRISDGSDIWGYFTEATPGAPNSTPSYEDFADNVPVFSVRGGMYSTSFTVELSTNFGGEIRYTLDGSEPGENDYLYQEPVPVNATAILRARILKPDQVPGPVVTQSYFINENSVDGKLPVVSVATAPENLWDPEVGIYVQDFKPEWEVPINIELFENNGSDRAAFNETAGAQINGLYSWQLPQKMVGIYFKKQFGPSNLAYPVTHQRKRSSYKNFALRASGSDWSYTLFRDMLGQHATLLNMNLDIMGFRPSVVYFNGEYMGIHNIREKVDDDYIEKSYDMEPGTFDLVENEDFAEAGDTYAYREVFLPALESGLADENNFNRVVELMNIEDFTDLVITEMAVANTSISHNVMAWKPKDHGKWKWVVMDLDRGFFNSSSNLISFYRSQEELPFLELLQNQGYCNYFAQRLADQLYTSFHPERMKSLIDEHAGDIEAEIPTHIDRWYGTTSSYGNAIPSVDYWRNEVADLKAFVEERPMVLLNDVVNSTLFDFNGIVNLSLASYPEGAGNILIDSLIIPGSPWTGPHLEGVTVDLEAESKPGYEFLGWINNKKEIIVSKGSSWKYLDDGTDQGTGWREAGFNDASWSSGAAQLGYGDGDETTLLGYGGNSSNKYITSYFRKNFTLTAEQTGATNLIIDLLRDDGAVIYLNGQEVVRSNMEAGEVNYMTLAASSVGGSAEDYFNSFLLDDSLLSVGENILAVEIHQSDAGSSDISFDLELTGFIPDNSSYLSTEKTYPVTLSDDLSLTAYYQKVSDCVIPDVITEDLTLDIGCSPYLVQGDVYIDQNATLTIDPGVEILMPAGASIFVSGVLNANGTEESGITFRLNPDYGPDPWGVITFRNTPSPSSFAYVTIEDASMGPDPVLDIAAISAFHADLVLDHLTLENNHGNPIVARYADVTLTNSSLHSPITGDLINVKYGKARIEHCRFVGNDLPDTDAIDYDEILDGIIRHCHITGLFGFNSDAIDIGEEAVNVMIDSIFVYNITDKGVSVGQQSTATISNSTFINCNMGVGLKDSARAIIDQCVFYSVVNPVKCFEKNPGQAGGNAYVYNSILSNSSDAPYFVDSKSSFRINYSMTDEDIWPVQSTNTAGNPLFEKPTFFDFELKPGSPAINAGRENGSPVNLGTVDHDLDYDPPVMISRIFINAGPEVLPEFLTIYNPSEKTVNLSGYRITRGITDTIPEGTYLAPNDYLYLTDNAGAWSWTVQDKQVFQWNIGKLANEGEKIQMEDAYGIVVDYLEYKNDGLWPASVFTDNLMLELISADLDNHFPESWRAASIDFIFSSTPTREAASDLRIYPNPARNLVTLEAPSGKNKFAEIYNMTGMLLGREPLDESGSTTLDLSIYDADILIIRVGQLVEKVILLR